MIEFNGRQYAETEREVIDSLFNPGGTVAGKAKRHAKRIDLIDIATGETRGAITCGGVVATVSRHDGRAWYSYGWPEIAGPELGLGATRDAIEALAVSRAYVRGEPAYRFK